jgi:hypothetical protein
VDPYSIFLTTFLDLPLSTSLVCTLWYDPLTQVRVKEIWLVQGLSAAFIRMIEFTVNYKIVSAISSANKRKTLKVIAIFSAMGVLAGRVYDIYDPNDFLSYSSVRLGMALVSVSGVVQAVYCIYCLRECIQKIDTKAAKRTRSYKLVSHSAVRMVFIQLIDVGLIIGFIWARTSYYSLWFHWVFDNLDNCRSLLLLMDLICSKLVPTESVQGMACSRITGFEATGIQSESKSPATNVVE